MKKKKKFKKFLKVSSILIVVLLISSISFGFASYLSITKNTTLNVDALTRDESNISYYDDKGNILQSFNTYKKSENLKDYTINAFVAKEDKRFYEHHGYDIIRIFGALKNNITEGEIVEGGSTISQQLIKTTQTNSERTLNRKLKEFKMARELEKNFSKEEIIQMYLDNIYFGNNCYGIEQASQFYFGLKASDLNIAQSAMLSGLISAPSYFNPVVDYQLSIEKTKMVLNLMREQSYISDEEYVFALNNMPQITSKQDDATLGAIYLERAYNEACEILGVESLPSNKKIEIKMYLNSELQKLSEDLINTGKYTVLNSNEIEPSIISLSINNTTGGVTSYAGKSKYELFNLRRQPASTIKPILVYAPAIDKNKISPSTFILDEPININGYSPQNASKTNYGWTTVRNAIVKSTNIPAVKILNESNLSESKRFAENMGIKFSENDNNLALALGGFEYGVTMLELSNAYRTFANGGVYSDISFVKEIIIDGNKVYNHTPISSTKRVMKDSTAYLMTDMLIDVTKIGTAKNVGNFNFDVASKTGTNNTNHNNNDAINVSYTTEDTFLCWIGNTDGAEGVMDTKINGSTYPAMFTKRIIAKCYEDHQPKNFEMPASVKVVNLDKTDFENHIVSAVSGSAPEDQIICEIFAVDNLPQAKIEPIVTPMTETEKNEQKLFDIFRNRFVWLR